MGSETDAAVFFREGAGVEPVLGEDGAGVGDRGSSCISLIYGVDVLGAGWAILFRGRPACSFLFVHFFQREDSEV